MAMPVDHLRPDLRRQARLIYQLESVRAPVVHGWFVHLSNKGSPQKRLSQPHPIPNKKPASNRCADSRMESSLYGSTFERQLPRGEQTNNTSFQYSKPSWTFISI